MHGLMCGKFLKKGVDLLLTTTYNVVNNKGGEIVSPESRAEYYRELRRKKKQFVVLVENEKMEAFEKKLKENNETRTAWLNRKIDEELGAQEK